VTTLCSTCAIRPTDHDRGTTAEARGRSQKHAIPLHAGTDQCETYVRTWTSVEKMVHTRSVGRSIRLFPFLMENMKLNSVKFVQLNG
jgi:hypothetical protein